MKGKPPTPQDDCAQIAESGLKPPFESPRLDFPEIDSRESIRKKTSILKALGQIRASRVFPPIPIQIRVIRVQSSLPSIPWKADSQKEGFLEARIDSCESDH